MPLPVSEVERELTHTRRVRYEGYKRADGLWDIEAHLLDTKNHDYQLKTGIRRAGQPIHDMWIRVTIDRSFVIHAIQAVTDGMPYPGACNRIGPAYQKLVGANLIKGFRKHLHDVVGGVQGCTHLTEMLSFLPTAAVQTFAGLVREDEGEGKPFQLDHCHALETTTDTVREYYPTWYRGQVIDPPGS